MRRIVYRKVSYCKQRDRDISLILWSEFHIKHCLKWWKIFQFNHGEVPPNLWKFISMYVKLFPHSRKFQETFPVHETQYMYLLCLSVMHTKHIAMRSSLLHYNHHTCSFIAFVEGKIITTAIKHLYLTIFHQTWRPHIGRKLLL